LKNADVITNTGMNQRQSGWNPDILRSLIAVQPPLDLNTKNTSK